MREVIPRVAALQTDTARRNLYPLTSLRFFAALYVLLFHSGAGFAEKAGLPGFIVTFLHNGWFGVSTFFVLSGFILTYTYRDGVASRRRLYDFFTARFARIYPVYVLALAVMLPLVTLNWIPALKTLALVQAWGPVQSDEGYYWIMQAWSLSVEAAFYVLFPLLIFLVKAWGKNSTWTGMACVGVCMVTLATPQLRPGMEPPRLFAWLASVPLPFYRFLEFVYGVFLCKLLLLNKPPQQRNQFVILLLILSLLALLALTQEPRLLSVATLLVGAVIYLLASSEGAVIRLLSSPLLVLAGGASYAIYMLHGPIREWLRRLISSPSVVQAVYPLLVIAISAAVFRWYEQPLRKWIRGAVSFSAPGAERAPK